MGTGQRNSRIEFLRIVTMFCIILSHSCSIGIINRFSFEQQIQFTSTYIFASIVSVGGWTGNCIFMMITGYYTSQKASMSWDKNIALIMKLTVYYWIMIILYIVSGYQTVDKITLIKMSVPFYFGYSWYVSAYVIFCAFIPILNFMTDKLEDDKLRHLILLIFVFGVVLPTFFVATFMYSGMLLMLLSYLAGAYIRRNEEIFCLSRSRIVYLISILCYILSVICFCLLGKMTNKPILFYKANIFGQILGGLFAFSVFVSVVKKKILNVKTVNIVGKSMLGVYILHDNPVVANTYWNLDYPFQTGIGYDYWIFQDIIKVVILFVVLILCEMLLNAIVGRPIDFFACRVCKKIGNIKREKAK